jgi:hypothetical protein
MQKLTVILFTLLLSLPFTVQSRDLEADEVELRESPQQMYDALNKTISFPLAFQNRDQFERAAQEQGYNPLEFEQILYLLARLNMEPNVKTKVDFQNAKSLIELLSTAAQSPYELAMVAMLMAVTLAVLNRNIKKRLVFIMKRSPASTTAMTSKH